MTEIRIIKADITSIEVDVIVNAANNSLLGGGGVDGAVHLAAGSELLVECSALNGCETGQAKITGGYNLPARYVIHAVGPVWRGGEYQEAELLHSCYEQSLALAKKHSCKSIAYPAISCGAYGYPPEHAAEIAINTIQECLFKSNNIETVNLVCFDEVLFQTYQKTYARLVK